MCAGNCNDALLKKTTRGRWSCVGATSVLWTIHEIIDYTPVNSNSHGKSPFYLGRTASNGPFSIARLNLQVKKRSTEVSICYQARRTFDRFLRSSQNLARLVWHPLLTFGTNLETQNWSPRFLFIVSTVFVCCAA